MAWPWPVPKHYLAHKNVAAKISSFSSATGGVSEWNWMTKENNQ